MMAGFTNHSIEAILKGTPSFSKPPSTVHGPTEERSKPSRSRSTTDVRSRPTKRSIEQNADEPGPSSSTNTTITPVSSEAAIQRRPKRPRHTYTREQLQKLEHCFYCTRGFLDPTSRAFVADYIGIDQEQAQVWFQNRRSKCRKREGPVFREMPVSLYLLNNYMEMLTKLPPSMATSQLPPPLFYPPMRPLESSHPMALSTNGYPFYGAPSHSTFSATNIPPIVTSQATYPVSHPVSHPVATTSHSMVDTTEEETSD